MHSRFNSAVLLFQCEKSKKNLSEEHMSNIIDGGAEPCSNSSNIVTSQVVIRKELLAERELIKMVIEKTSNQITIGPRELPERYSA
jgi:hypothetical protein